MITEIATWFYNQTIGLSSAIGPIGLIIAMVVQAIFVIIPSELVLMAAGASLGLPEAIFYGTIGEMLGAVVAFFISVKFEI